jgi:Leucine-rich repeat (LRR) protein
MWIYLVDTLAMTILMSLPNIWRNRLVFPPKRAFVKFELKSCLRLVSKQGRSSLTSLFLQRNSITDDGVHRLCTAIVSTALPIAKLCLHTNRVGVAGARSLAALLAQNQSLTSLNLMFNKAIGVDGITELAGSLALYNRTLTELHIGWTDAGATGAEAIAAALSAGANQHSLRVLVLDNNGIGDAGAIALSTALRENSGLQELQLATNDITDVGATALATALLSNVTLQKLGLTYVQLVALSQLFSLHKLSSLFSSLCLKFTFFQCFVVLPFDQLQQNSKSRRRLVGTRIACQCLFFTQSS